MRHPRPRISRRCAWPGVGTPALEELSCRRPSEPDALVTPDLLGSWRMVCPGLLLASTASMPCRRFGLLQATDARTPRTERGDPVPRHARPKVLPDRASIP